MVSVRVGEYIEAKGISYYAFENKLGASRGSISKAVKDGKSIGSNVLENFRTLYRYSYMTLKLVPLKLNN